MPFKSCSSGKPVLRVVALLALLVISAAAAATLVVMFPSWEGSTESGRLPAAFYPPESLRAEDVPRGFQQILPAVVQYFAQPPECARKSCQLWPCTGVFISKEGHLLTSLHCLENIALFREEDRPEAGLKLHRFDPGLAALNDFGIRFARGTGGQASAQIVARVATAGLGFRSILPTAGNLDKKKYLETMDTGLGPPGDFAILKLPLTSTPCVPIPSSAASLATDPDLGVWSLAYPSQTTRLDGYDSPGFKRLYSEGKVTRGISENQAFLQRYKALPEKDRRDLLDIYHLAFDREGTFASTLDAASGSSGGPVFNQEGLLVGLLISTETFGGNSTADFHSGATRALSIRRILQTLSETTSDASRFFQCH